MIEFADFGNFEQTYNSQGSIFLNILDGLLIVTGENHDQFFHYSHNKHSMTKLSKLNNNHSHGSLLYDERSNSVYCISGWHNRRVEKYSNDEIIQPIIKSKNQTQDLSKSIKNSWINLPELTIERSESPFIIFENYIYGFFGFNYPQMKYLDSIERMNLDSYSNWEVIFYSNHGHISTSRKAFGLIKRSETEVLFIGGYDGQNESPIENFSFFDFKKKEFFETERKFPDLNNYHIYSFQNNSSSIPYIDFQNRLHYVCFDDKELVHAVECKSLQYDIFASFD